MMYVKFFGTRGSIPVPGPQYSVFGGNTTCIQIMASETKRIGVFDAGTGIRNLGNSFYEYDSGQNDIFITFSHFHWDHIQGFPFFAPAYDRNIKINVLAMGGNREIHNLKDIFDLQMQEKYFPVALDEMGATFEFLLVKKNEEVFIPPDQIPVKLKVVEHDHPGGCYSYRYERLGKSIVISTDIEHGEILNDDIIELAEDADILIHDGQYSNEELMRKRGWGHSSFEQAIEVAKKANVKKLIITHHDPDHDDTFLLDAERKCQKLFPECLFAREDMVVST